MRPYKTSNPAFNKYFWDDDRSSSDRMTVRGIIIKTLFHLMIVSVIVGYIWKIYEDGTPVRWFTLGGMLASIVISIVISIRNHWVHILVPLYAVAKGCFIGGFSSYIQVKFPELPYQAVGITVVTFFTMFALYQTRIIVVTKRLRTVIVTAAASIFLFYIISWILSFFGIYNPIIWGTSWVSIGFTVFASIVAAFTLLLDFNFIEKQKGVAPKYKEWMATWGLLVSLVWLYVETLRLLRKLAIRF